MSKQRSHLVRRASKKAVKSEISSSQEKSSIDSCSFHDFSVDEISQVQQSLLNWYDKVKRDLPWRRLSETTKDIDDRAYGVWVSEIMLQQTQVATVVNYYNKWMKKWPTLQSLAVSDIESVNEAWKGLGYYSRGRRLFEGAQKVVNELDSKMPNNAEDLQKHLPGVGRYTAGAISSIAFGQVTGLVDGNVMRVLSRLRMIGGDITQPDTVSKFWLLANQLVDKDRPGDFNQSMMELGATVCTPKSPSCQKCPVKSLCKAYAKVNHIKKSTSQKFYQQNDVKDEKPDIIDIECLVPDCKQCLPSHEPWKNDLGVMNYPHKAKKAKPKEECLSVIILKNKAPKCQERFLISKRPESGLLAGLWEFPNQMQMEDKSEVISFISNLLNVSQESVKEPHQLGDVVHQFTHIRQTYQVWLAELTVSPTSADTCVQAISEPLLKWQTEDELGDAAIPKGMLKVFDLMKNSKKVLKRKKGQVENIEQVKKKPQTQISQFFKKVPV